jgi:hypothetical protein
VKCAGRLRGRGSTVRQKWPLGHLARFISPRDQSLNIWAVGGHGVWLVHAVAVPVNWTQELNQ